MMRVNKNTCDISQNSVLRMNDQKTLQLIQEYKKEECLWNTSLDDYPNRSKRVRAAEKIARLLNIRNFEGKHVMIKFKNLRNSYCQELKKIAHSLSVVGSEDSPEMYQPKVRWFSLMDSFIRPHLQAARPAALTALRLQKEYTTNIKMENYECEEQEDWAVQSKDSIPETSYSQSDQFASENEELSNESRAKRRRLSNDSRAKRRRMSNSSSPSEHFSQTQVFLPSDVPSQIAPREDTYDSFGKYIASLLRNLPLEKALRLQPKIVKMIVEVGVKEEASVRVEIDRLGDNSESD